MAGEEHDVAHAEQQAPTADCTRCGAGVPLTLAGPFPGCRHCGNTQPLSAEIAAKVSAVRGHLEQRAVHHRQMTGRLVAKAAGFHGMTIAVMITTWLPFDGTALEFALGSELHVADHNKVVNADLLVAQPGKAPRLLHVAGSDGRSRELIVHVASGPNGPKTTVWSVSQGGDTLDAATAARLVPVDFASSGPGDGSGARHIEGRAAWDGGNMRVWASRPRRSALHRCGLRAVVRRGRWYSCREREAEAPELHAAHERCELRSGPRLLVAGAANEHDALRVLPAAGEFRGAADNPHHDGPHRAPPPFEPGCWLIEVLADELVGVDGGARAGTSQRRWSQPAIRARASGGLGPGHPACHLRFRLDFAAALTIP